MRLKGKVAIITGGGTGLGRAYAVRFAAEGAKVAVVARNLSRLEDVVKEIEAKGGEALAVQTDISDEASTQEMAKRTAERFGKIDILVNNAGVLKDNLMLMTPLEDYELIMDTNLKGTYLCMQRAAKMGFRMRMDPNYASGPAPLGEYKIVLMVGDQKVKKYASILKDQWYDK